MWAFSVCMCEQKVLGNKQFLTCKCGSRDKSGTIGLCYALLGGKKSQPLYERPHFPPLATLFPSIANAELQIVNNVIYY